VGAGPAGLSLALVLLQNNVGVRIIDKLSSYHRGQKGFGPRTLEMHHFLGTLADVRGHTFPDCPCNIYKLPGGEEVVKTFHLATPQEPTAGVPYPNTWWIGQDNHEAVLRAHLAKYGCSVELSTELVAIDQSPESVTVSLVKTLADGTQVSETSSFQFVVGTDGAHSTVRKQLGLSFLGETRAKEFLTGDIYVLEGLATDCWHMWGDFSNISMTIRPCENAGVFSISMLLKPDDQLPTTRQEFIDRFYEFTGRRDVKFGELVWLGKWRPNIRMVDTFHKGRVFVGGDAAHVHSPAGGQGLNSGMQDVLNLGWKLSLAVKGFAHPGLLNTYSIERFPVIAEMLRRSTNLDEKTISTGADKGQGLERGGPLHQLGVNYRSSPIVFDTRQPRDDGSGSNAYEATGPLTAGDRAPNSPLLDLTSGQATSMFDLFKATHHTVIAFTSDIPTVISALVSLLDKYPTGILTCCIVLPTTLEPVPQDVALARVRVLQDISNIGYQTYEMTAKDGDVVVIVRPDGVIGAVTSDPNGSERYFSKIIF
ncbi:hypothetical protein FISHEDRAFT_44919, partial [Fistulina hepatica ATCC 64428]